VILRNKHSFLKHSKSVEHLKHLYYPVTRSAQSIVATQFHKMFESVNFETTK